MDAGLLGGMVMTSLGPNLSADEQIYFFFKAKDKI